MKDMKMSDVFNLPLQQAVNELAIIDKNDCVVGWADAFSGEAARDCIVESINNHDRLQQENAELREALEGAMRIKDLWLPLGAFGDSPPENYQEIEALHLMAKSFDKLLTKND